MKKYILILSILANSIAYSQNNFPTSNAIWSVESLDLNNEILYGLKGDTLIRDTLYNKLYLLSDTILLDKNLKKYIGGFWQEKKKVWFKPANWKYKNILLYDFSANKDDIIQHNAFITTWYDDGDPFFEPSTNPKNIIEKTYKIETNDIKTYLVYPSNGGYTRDWYENIGSNLGLFGSIIIVPLSGPKSYLQCLKHNDIIKYKSPDCKKCFYHYIKNDIENKKHTKNWINIYTNPIQKILTVEINKPYSKIMVEIFDQRGSILYQKESLDNPITLNSLYRGIYFVKLLIDNKIVMKKVIIN